MRNLLLGTTFTLAIAFLSPASAMPAGYPLLRDAAAIDLIEVKVGMVMDMAGVTATVGGEAMVITRMDGAAAARWVGAAMAARPAIGRRVGAEPRSAAIWDRRISF